MTDTIYQAAMRAYFDNAIKAVMREETPHLPPPYDMLRSPREVWEFNQELDKQAQEWMMSRDEE